MNTPDTLTLECFVDDAWREAATLIRLGPERDGIRAAVRLAYHLEYAVDHTNSPGYAVSCRYPVNLDWHTLDHWPAFLLDLIPSGAARRYWCERLGLSDGPASDWALLAHGAGNPVGRLRVREACETPAISDHPGFTREEIIERSEAFLDYARACGAPVSGASGAQGEAPKFLLSEDRAGRWHADGALSDRQVARHWLVKFPRGRTERDRLVLRNEAAYHRVAQALGLTLTEALPQWQDDVLFVPRFDRQILSDRVRRLGVESLSALAGASQFGAPITQEPLLDALARFSDDAQADILEYLCRDAMNLALGNTDNHGRNTALLITPEGARRLAPLFDLAPMYLDPQGVARHCRWAAESLSRPRWDRVIEQTLARHPWLDAELLCQGLAAFAQRLHRVAPQLLALGLSPEVAERRAGVCEEIAAGLAQGVADAAICRERAG